MDGNLYLWKLDPDSAIVSQTAIHKKFIAQVSAITYRPSKRWLLSASRGRFLMTDLNTLESAGLVAYTQIVSQARFLTDKCRLLSLFLLYPLALMTTILLC